MTYKPITRFNANDDEPESISLVHGELMCFSIPSPIKETPNEDALAIVPINDETTVLVVADGMGGMPAGEQASMIVVKSIIQSVRDMKDNRKIREAIIDGIDNANKHVLDLKGGSGSTVSVAEIYQNQLRSYHVGDSLILLTSSHGNIKYQSMSHSPIGYALECGIMDQRNAMLHHERNLISNYVGAPNMHIQIGPTLELATKDSLILSSDALSDNLYEQEISEFIRKQSLVKGVNDMIKKCQHNMMEPLFDRLCHPDDLSLICFRYDQDT